MSDMTATEFLPIGEYVIPLWTETGPPQGFDYVDLTDKPGNGPPFPTKWLPVQGSNGAPYYIPLWQ